ncbi:response regulator [Oceanospirillum sediminis]|uniref:Sensory/regulatory protein RpfC n=1 Tax=Oceanospirillum sediminis TaxID=2760088 RepID=A0A839IMW4_9GAMM|nr:response regulator [Oceanospirillum sediminis]MBB1486241.1 response regulator [Oceanospirillum sediminis]
MRLMSKVILTGTLSVLLIIGALSYFLLSGIEKTLSEELDNQLNGSLKLAASKIEQQQNDILRISSLASKNRGFSRALDLYESRGVNQILNNLPQVYPFIHYALITEPDGSIFASSTRSHSGDKLAGEQLLLKNAFENPRFILPIGSHPVAGHYGTDTFLQTIGLQARLSQWLVAPLTRKDQTIGYLILAVDWRVIQHNILKTIVTDLLLEGRAVEAVLLTDQSYRVEVSHYATGMDGSEWRPYLVKEGQQFFFRPGDDLVWKHSSLYDGDDTVKLVVIYNQERAFRLLGAARQTIIEGSLLCLLVLIGVFIVLVRLGLVARLEILYQGAEKIGQGDLEQRLPELGKDEIGNLAVAMNRMASNLQKTTASREQLDHQVHEKQRALSDLADRQFALDQHAIVAITDVKGTITYVNKKFCTISGYHQKELVGQNHRILNSGYHDSEFFKEMYRTIARGDVWHGELRNRNKSGEFYWVDTTIVPLMGSNSKPISYISIRTDITSRKQAELAQKESARQLELVIASTEVGMWDWKVQTGQVIFNERWANIIGYTLAELEPVSIDTWMQFAHPDDLEESGRLLEAHWQGESESYCFEARMKHKTGHWVWVLDTGRVVEWEADGKPRRMIGTHLDISEQKEAEQRIRKNMALQESILNSTDNGILVTDLQGNIIRFNQQFIHLWQIPDDLQQEKNFKAVTRHARKQLKTPELFENSLHNKKQTHDASFDILEFNDGRVYEQVAMPMMMDNMLTGWVWSFRDETERIKAQNALIHAKEAAEAATRAKSEFLASMSHEIRTPMNGVIGMLGLLLNTNLTEDQQHRARIAQSSAHSLLTLINDILDYSKAEAGRIDLECIDFNLTSMLSEFAESMAFQAQGKELELVLDAGEVEYAVVRGDPERLRQILTNLVSNAIKFTQKGEVIIRAGLHDHSSSQWRFTCAVIDSGIGIPADKQGALFDSFSQVDSSTTRQYGGTGLGLAIVRKLCHLMQGEVSVDSQPGQGSCFEINVLLEKSDLRQRVIPDVDISQLELLIVDDNPVNREVLTGQLQHWGAHVSEAENAQQALALCQKKAEISKCPPFDAAFLDMQMPEMDGAELGHILQQDDRYRAMKLVMMTSMAQKGDAEHFQRLGFSGYFPKPATPSDLINALKLIVTGSTDASDSPAMLTRHYVQSMPQPRLHNETLLLVEDNHVNQLVVTGILEELGYHIITAGNGLEAIETLNQYDDGYFALILMDCQMPEMDGYEACRQVRSGVCGDLVAGLPIVALTANAMTGDKEKCLAAGMDDYLAKPIVPEDLISKLNHWLPEASLSVSETTLAEFSGAAENTDISGYRVFSDDDKTESYPIWDRADFEKRILGIESVFNELIETFLEELPGKIAEFSQVYQQQDFYQLRNLAHALKGEASNLSACRLQHLAYCVEKTSESVNAEQTEKALEELQEVAQQTILHLNHILEKNL